MTKKINEATIIKKITFVGLFGNIVLTAFKLIAGIVGNSGAMVSDAVHSLSDVFATFIAFLGVKLSKRSADEEHPFGHERLECVASLILGIILFVTGVGIGKVGLTNIISGNYESLSVPGVIALVAAIVSIVSKEAMYWYTKHYAKIINSPAFLADAWHHRSDALSSIGSLIGIAGARLGFPVLDSVASVIICIFILKVSFDILVDAIKKMMDTACPEDVVEKMKEAILSNEDVLEIDDMKTRLFGAKIYAEVEISVDANKTFVEAHNIAEAVHEKMEKEFPDVKHCMVHANPRIVNEENK